MITYLKWDSSFFCKKIGRIEQCITIDHLKSTLMEAKLQEYDLLYVFTDEYFFIKEQECFPFKGTLVDRKVVYSMDIIGDAILPPKVIEYLSSELTPELFNLAFESGKYSRFYLDNGFNELEFHRLYSRWIEKSVSHEIADKVFVTLNNNKVTGMVSLKLIGDSSEIGLIAVDSKLQGKGYGKLLMQRCLSEAVLFNCKTLSVPTQYANKSACNFYERCGFQVQSITNIYHFWL
jgi:dTDP-4-amino-4,6-dideoxy-D-galactose acyltransferase